MENPLKTFSFFPESVSGAPQIRAGLRRLAPEVIKRLAVSGEYGNDSEPAGCPHIPLLADAAIVSWECKYKYNSWRPITAIQDADTDGNADTSADPDWMPLLETPPFPEYTSGHNTFSGTATVILASFFGKDAIPFSIGSDDLPGVHRFYSSFSEASRESGMSRIYGGIHFMSANLNGLASGAAVGQFVAAHWLLPKGNRSRN
jgi:hypothetical protein